MAIYMEEITPAEQAAEHEHEHGHGAARRGGVHVHTPEEEAAEHEHEHGHGAARRGGITFDEVTVEPAPDGAPRRGGITIDEVTVEPAPPVSATAADSHAAALALSHFAD